MVVRGKSTLEPTLGHRFLQLHNVVSGAEGGGDDEGEEQLLGSLHQVLQDRLDVVGGLLEAGGGHVEIL